LGGGDARARLSHCARSEQTTKQGTHGELSQKMRGG
jgi:hypothetical protein